MFQERYQYHNLPIPGGGYVTGYLFHPGKEDILYCRTDIGGTYRFDRKSERWVSLTDHVTMDDLAETFPIALAVDENNPALLYIACGVNAKPHGKLAVSKDFGETFSYYEMPMHVHGNLNGRGTGYRLIVDKKDANTLWFASQESGLWKSVDGGASWTKNEAYPEDYMTFVGQTKDGRVLFAAGAGVTTKRAVNLRGHSLYVSYDDGASFEPLWAPADGPVEGVKLAGLVAQRYAMDALYLYVTYAVMGRNAYVNELGYSCDAGSVIGGKVVRYPLSDGTIGQGEDITPGRYGSAAEGSAVSVEQSGNDTAVLGTFLEYGFSGIDTVRAVPGMLAVSTICKGDGDCIYRSADFGKTWTCILHDLDIGKMEFRASYMKPEYNGGHSLIHWLTDLKCNPFNKDEMWFNTGTGTFRTMNLTDRTVVFEDWCDGIEETVHLNLYSPPEGDVICIDILGDLGGFAFRDTVHPCDNSFADESGNRYITCINADYSDATPACVIVTPRGNWTGHTKGGLILSEDQCRTFRRLPMPFGLSERLDQTLHAIETPNVNSGWIAMARDCKQLVWSVAYGINLPVSQVVVSGDGGETWALVKVYDRKGKQKTEGGFKVFSDRDCSERFFGFGDHSDIYVSEDGGKTFFETEKETVAETDQCHGQMVFPEIDFSLIDCANKTEVRGDSGKLGCFYFSARENGLWRMEYTGSRSVRLTRLGREGDVFYRLGLGVGRPGGNYFSEPKVLYVAASIDGAYGFYRSADEGATFVRLNTARQMFGEVNSIEGDSRTYGRFYIATGSRGVLCGEPE